MGAFLVNFHVRTDSAEKVSETLRLIPVEAAWLAGPQGGWISFWEQQASQQDSDGIQFLAKRVSQSLDVPVIAFLVHDSDVFCYWLYDGGRLRDEYNSCPGYWEDEDLDEESLAADCTVLGSYCRPDADLSQLNGILAQWTRADVAAGRMPAFTFAEERLTRLGPLLGLRDEVLLTDYGDIGRDISPDELQVTWIGSGEPPDDDSSVQRQSIPLPHAPLHEAAAKNDVAAIERMIAEGADVNEVPQGYLLNALAMAAMHATPATVRRLVELGADLHAKPRGGNAPLRSAVLAGRHENVRTLVELGAHLDEYDERMGTLLHLAVLQASADMIGLLLELGVDPQRKGPAGTTPLEALQAQLDAFQQIKSKLPDTALHALGGRIQYLEEIRQMLSDHMGPVDGR